MKLIIVANRLPISIKSTEPLTFERSPGGLVSGILSFLQRSNIENYVWLGWVGSSIKKKAIDKISSELMDKIKSVAVYIPDKLMERFYNGFCNKTLWPLFHGMYPLAVYDESLWESYVEVNKIFAQYTLKELEKEDALVWVHDYHLMLLPSMIRNMAPDAKIGFFLHIPFPPPEIFSYLPWRVEVLEGLLGADLIGFHTYEYTINFLRSLSKILGVEHTIGEFIFANRLLKVDTFPMGIDFQLFHDDRESAQEIMKIKKALGDKRIIFSVDRLDYTKGIYNRLLAFEEFLKRRDDWKGRVVMILNIVPSREGVEHYQRMKRQIEEKISEINGKFGSVEWVPILYHYRSLNTKELIAYYRASDVILVTPIKDGMNLVAKEFVASRNDLKGVIILSEFAGSSKELGEAILVNPNNIRELSLAIERALEMPEEEQARRLVVMQARLKRYDITKWGRDFIEALKNSVKRREELKTRELNYRLMKKIKDMFRNSNKRLLLLDYDGTLVPLSKSPDRATPTEEVRSILRNIALYHNTNVVLISGRRREDFERWFKDLPIYIVAEHGCFVRKPDGEWEIKYQTSSEFEEVKEKVKNIMETYADRLPQSMVEEKECAIVFHYRNSDQEMANLRVAELVEELRDLLSGTDLSILMGSKIVEVRPAGINKGSASLSFCSECDFILAVGDDITDEDMFRVLPQKAITIKVGLSYSFAKYSVDSHVKVLELLKYLIEDEE